MSNVGPNLTDMHKTIHTVACVRALVTNKYKAR